VFIQRTRIVPALGKAAVVEAELVQAVKNGQAKGRRVALGRRVFSSEGAAFVVTLLADDLAALDAVRRENAADAEFQARGARLAPNLGDAIKQVVLEGIVVAQPRQGTTITVMTSSYPAQGKERQVVSILEEWTKAGQAAGMTLGLFRRVFSSDGPSIAAIGRYADLAEYDRFRKERAAFNREAATAVSELSRAPIAQRFTEVVVPMPA
jgi:hypothetical protein